MSRLYTILDNTIRRTQDSAVCVLVPMEQITVPANGTITKTDIDISASVPQGYKAIGAIPSQSGNNALHFYNCVLDSTGTLIYQLKNVGGAVTVTPRITIICVKV